MATDNEQQGKPADNTQSQPTPLPNQPEAPKPIPPSNEPRGYSNNFNDNKGTPSSKDLENK
ncbi:MAG TPA: hypothetical protein VK543_14850 [Puia sp.]|nr:hypothetical protein [Puia sp.]